MNANEIIKDFRDALTGAIGGDINGRILIGERPDDSVKEDVVINCVSLTQYPPPQRGTFNVNIHTPDMSVKIDGKAQKIANTDRLTILTDKAVRALKEIKHDGAQSYISSVQTFRDVGDHYSNIRLEWTAHKFDYYE